MRRHLEASVERSAELRRDERQLLDEEEARDAAQAESRVRRAGLEARSSPRRTPSSRRAAAAAAAAGVGAQAAKLEAALSEEVAQGEEGAAALADVRERRRRTQRSLAQFSVRSDARHRPPPRSYIHIGGALADDPRPPQPRRRGEAGGPWIVKPEADGVNGRRDVKPEVDGVKPEVDDAGAAGVAAASGAPDGGRRRRWTCCAGGRSCGSSTARCTPTASARARC